jgi:alpha-galactosidase
MLEVGNLPTQEEDRTHFAAWCVTSSPLVLGLDLTDTDKVDGVWGIIANPGAIAVNKVTVCTVPFPPLSRCQ